MRNKIIFFLFVFCSFSTLLNGQQLWPGDANNNGEVNVVDALYVGIAYGETGTVRSNASNNWTAQDITTLWTGTFFNGLNHAYADCDGNGVIDKDDIKNPIKDNYGLTHGVVTPDIFLAGTQGVDVPLKLINTSGTGTLSGSMDIDIDLGEMDLPANDFYGIAFSIVYDATIIEDLEFDIDPSSWIEGSGDETHELALENTVTGTYDIVVTRKDQNPISGFGKIGQLNIIIEDIVVGLLEPDTTIQLLIQNIKMITAEMTEIPVVNDSIMLTIANTTALKQMDNLGIQIQINPNPVKDFFVVKSDKTMIKSIHLYNLLGELVSFKQGIESDKILYPSSLLKAGTYIVVVETEEGSVSKKIIKN